MTKEQRIKEKKEYREYLSIADKRVLDTKNAGIELVSKDEVFVLVNSTRNYWISNHARLVNNLRGNFYMHNTDKERSGNRPTHFTLTAYDEEGNKCTIDKYLDVLVADHFLEKVNGANRIWHIDNDVNNCTYKNLIFVSDDEYANLKSGIIDIEDIDRIQEYVRYVSLKSNSAYSIWNGIYTRCYKPEVSSSGECYNRTFMCDKWLHDRDLFVEWYNSNYYECDGESMAVDKDLLFPGNKEYAPDKCCLLPQTLNTMLANCKKHKLPYWKKAEMDLPLGVRYSSKFKKYYSTYKPFGHDEIVTLGYWETSEEAFAEYKTHKQADILLMADKYKNKIPKHIYEALLRYEVKPFAED